MKPAQTQDHTKPFPIRLSVAERTELERQAGSQPLGTYIKSVVLGADARAKRGAKRPVKHQASLAKLLGMFGQSDIAARLDALAKATENGALIVDEDTVAAIHFACAEVHAMHALLMQALGFQVSEEESLSSAFNGAASESEVSQ